MFANVKTGGAYSYHCAYRLKQLCILKEVLSDLFCGFVLVTRAHRVIS